MTNDEAQPDTALEGAVDEFLDALAAGDMDRICRFAVCPNCSAQYPVFHSPIGSLHTLCDDCGWSSEEEADRYRG